MELTEAIEQADKLVRKYRDVKARNHAYGMGWYVRLDDADAAAVARLIEEVEGGPRG